MRNDEFVKMLTESIKDLDTLERDLKLSVEQCRGFADKTGHSDESKCAHDAFLLRFSRLFDAFYHHHLRLLEVAKGDESMAPASEADVLKLREVRNAFVHKYSPQEQPGHYQAALDHFPLLLGLVEQARAYASKHLDAPKASLPPKRRTSSITK